MFRWAVICLIISLIAGGLGLTNISVFAKRLSMIFFALFFLGFLALLGFAYLLGAAFNMPSLSRRWSRSACRPAVVPAQAGTLTTVVMLGKFSPQRADTLRIITTEGMGPRFREDDSGTVARFALRIIPATLSFPSNLARTTCATLRP